VPRVSGDRIGAARDEFGVVTLMRQIGPPHRGNDARTVR
jgi:hypothetical protein